MKHFLYTVSTAKSFDAAVEAIEYGVAANGYSVLNTYDLVGSVAMPGFDRGPLKIMEVCSARHVDEILKRDISAALMLPCPIAVYTRAEKTFISTVRPAAFVEFSPDSGLEGVASQMESVFLQIVNAAR